MSLLLAARDSCQSGVSEGRASVPGPGEPRLLPAHTRRELCPAPLRGSVLGRSQGAYGVLLAGAEPGLCRAQAEPHPLAQALFAAHKQGEDTGGTGAWDCSVYAQGSASPGAAMGLL